MPNESPRFFMEIKDEEFARDDKHHWACYTIKDSCFAKEIPSLSSLEEVRELMEGFAEWASKNGWEYNPDKTFWGGGHAIHLTTKQLLNKYLEQHGL